MPPKQKTAPSRSRWERKPATDKALADFRESFRKGMGVAPEHRKVGPVDAIPTGSLDLDVALGIGGWRVGRIHEVWGPEHVGKTTLMILSCIEALKKFPDQMVGWIDMEQTFDEAWAEALGLDLSKVEFYTPATAEDVADAAKRMIQSGMLSMVVLDSVGGMISRIEFEKEADESVVANVAKIVTRMVLASSPVAASNGTTVMVINQVRSKIGSYGADTHTAGGWALKHITTSKVQLSSGGETPRTVQVYGDPLPVSKQIAARVQKNKSAPTGYRAKFWLTNVPTDKHGPIGIDTLSEAITVGRKLGVITGASWMVLPTGEKHQGAEKTKAFLEANPKALEALRAAVLAKVRNRPEVEPDVDADAEEMEAYLEAEEQ